MEEFIKELTIKANSCGTDTKAQRMVKGAYVDALVMAKEALNIHLIVCSATKCMSCEDDIKKDEGILLCSKCGL